MNYVFDDDKVYLLDLESSREHANAVHDLGIVAAELKRYFALPQTSPEGRAVYRPLFLALQPEHRGVQKDYQCPALLHGAGTAEDGQAWHRSG